jgi:alkyldihydroxyacetonephosphate synthase
VEPLRDRFDAVVSLDLTRLDAPFEVDERSLTATLGAGMLGPRVEEQLGRRGLTLGHFPQSYEQASIGGYAATRSAGQASTGYGRIDELVLGLRMASPAGDVELPALPASAAGPDLRRLVVGSEGILGAITEVALKVRPRPPVRRYEGWFFRSFADGADAFRALEQEHAAPDVARLSDEDETRLSLAAAGSSAARRAAGAYLRARGYAGGCLAIVGWEGDRTEVGHRRARTVEVLRRGGGAALGQAPGRAWARTRFEGPYQRDALLAHGVAVDTLETAAQWSRVTDTHGAIREALTRSLRGRGTPPLVLCHISHLYPSGSSLYFTWLARQEQGAELDQWREAKRAASDAIVASGATITHHHAVGVDHRPWLAPETSEPGLAALRAVKRELDPAGIMNPGKLLPG